MAPCTTGGSSMRPEAVVVFVVLCAVGLPLAPRPRRPTEPATPTSPVGPARHRASRFRDVVGRRRLVSRRRDALPLTLELLARELRSGLTILPAFEHVAAHADPSLDLPALVDRLRHGAGLTTAVDWWAGRFDPDDASVIAGVFHLGTETGTAVAGALDRAAAGIRARGELAAEVRALTAQSRASAVMVGCAPLGFGALLAVAEPSAVSFLFGSALGLACLAAGLLLDALGFWWMHRLVARVAP